MWERRAFRREVEVVVELLRGVRFEPHVAAPRRLASEHRQRALWNLREQIELQRRGRRIRDDELRAIHYAHEEFVGHKLVELLVALLPVAIAMTEKTLADQERRCVVTGFLGGLNLF